MKILIKIYSNPLKIINSEIFKKNWKKTNYYDIINLTNI